MILVAVRYYPFSLKIISLVAMVALLSLRLSGLTEEIFVVPVEDALFDVAFIAAEDDPANGKPLKVKTKRALDIILAQDQGFPALAGKPLSSPAFKIILPKIKDVRPEIFIPPETVS